MGVHGYLALWCGVFGTVALVGYARSLAGTTRVQRAIRVMGRIEQVREPRHGSSRRDGISVVVSFQDPSTGREFTVTNDPDHGERITAAWTGREVGVRYPRGSPHAHEFVGDLSVGRRGLGWPNSAGFLIYVGVVVFAAIDRGRLWALIGFGGLWAVFGAWYLPENVREWSGRIDALSSRPGFAAVSSPCSRTPAPTRTATPPPATHRSLPSPPTRVRPSPPTCTGALSAQRPLRAR
ncbi:DUF3592 domain-containing protein [Streptomyces sp. NPDC051572]|uniref:DUF3592 domain-containing protein n=1 Tax=Streptomyces sp. NPDC051572 TaxID=3155802 RepID=UPI00344E6910